MKINIVSEDESEIFADRVPGVVPFYMKEEYENGKTAIYAEVYSGAYEIAEAFFEKRQNNCFSDDALSEIHTAISEYLVRKGYNPEQYGRKRYYHSFEISDVNKVNTDVVKKESILLDREYKSLVTFDTQKILEKGLVAFVVLDKGKVVSIASVNENIQETNVLEVTVETSPKYRGKGYALSNTAAIAKYLAERGYKIAYCASRYNKASLKIAKRAGFEQSGRFYAVSGWI